MKVVGMRTVGNDASCIRMFGINCKGNYNTRQSMVRNPKKQQYVMNNSREKRETSRISRKILKAVIVDSFSAAFDTND